MAQGIRERGAGSSREYTEENNTGSGSCLAGLHTTQETLTHYDLFILLLCLRRDQRYSTMSQRTAILGHDLAGGLDRETGLRSSSNFCNRKSMLLKYRRI